LPPTEENNERFHEVALDEELLGEGAIASADFQGDSPRPLLRDGAWRPGATPENAADMLPATTRMRAQQREHTSFIIPGISTRRTDFAALSHGSDPAKVTKQEQSQPTSADKVAPQHAPVSLPHRGLAAMLDNEFLSRLEHLVDAAAQHSPERQRPSPAALLPSAVEETGLPNGERGDADMARQLTHLQRTVRELAATVSSQAARNREESQPQRRERMTSAPQRMVIIKSAEASLTTPRAFWERTRLGRFYLRTGR